jgi:hypothetical protein
MIKIEVIYFSTLIFHNQFKPYYAAVNIYMFQSHAWKYIYTSPSTHIIFLYIIGNSAILIYELSNL